jgi:cell division protein FtsA
MARRRSSNRATLGVLDIGTNKVICLIGEVDTNRDAQGTPIRVRGVGHQRSHGLKAGVITDPAAVETVVRAVVSQAERMAGVTLDEVSISISCGRLQSKSFAAHADIGPFGVTDQDIARLLQGARAYAEQNGRALVHMNRKAFHLDGLPSGDDPRGLAAKRLTAHMHAVTADDGPMRNLIHVVERCHLGVTGLIATPYASALAVTTEDERRLAVTVLDFGGGTTTAAVFIEGQLVLCEVMPTGGHHLAIDIAHNLQTPLAEAERIKALYASVVNAQSDVCDTFSYALAGDQDGATQQANRADLAAIIRPRLGLVLEALNERMFSVGLTSGPIVLTGGGSQLVGLAEFASHTFGRPVRTGRPMGLAGSAPGIENPAFATAAGLLAVARESDRGGAWNDVGDDGTTSYLGRVGRWLTGQF